MFKKVLMTALSFFVATFFATQTSNSPKVVNKKLPNVTVTPAKAQEIKKSIFVPYWSLGETTNFDDYDRLLYFGITADREGIDKKEPGFLNLNQFVIRAGGKEKYLTLRMVDSDRNFTILKDQDLQKSIIDEAVKIANQNDFRGVVLDLEVSSLFNDTISGEINGFVQNLYQGAKSQNLKLSLALYGDLIYRKKPYDLSSLAQNSDEIIIMAYDLHKAQGEPGPNFPLNGREIYGYDFTTMIKDFSDVIPPEKLSVAYGMYGYDWIVDEQMRPIKPAKSISFAQIQNKFLPNCREKNCKIVRDDKSQESEISFSDKDDNQHIIWFEDKKSSGEKNDYLLQNGINKIVYWAYGYF